MSEEENELKSSKTSQNDEEEEKSGSGDQEDPENEEETGPEEKKEGGEVKEKRNLLQLIRKKLLPVGIQIPEGFSLSHQVLTPLTNFTLLMGLHHGHTGNRILNWHRNIILFYMFSCTLRLGTQLVIFPLDQSASIQEMFFDPQVVLSFTYFIFILSGTLTLFFSKMIHQRRRLFLEAVDAAIDPEESAVTVEEGRKVAKGLVIINILLCMFGASAEFTLKFRMIINGMPWGWALITNKWYFMPLEPLLTLLAENSITLLAMDFYMNCTFLRYIIANLGKQMDHNFSDAPPLVKLQYLDEIQSHHHRLLSAKNLLEECYSLVVFLYYFFTIPCICFLSYICYRNLGGNSGMNFGMGIWIMVNLSVLLILSAPAFQLAEEGEKISQKAFDLYEISLKGEDDPRVSIKMTILLAQMQGNKILVSAYNYFPLSRNILLSMFSAIFTYFLILVQFGGSQANRCSSDEAAKILNNSSNDLM